MNQSEQKYPILRIGNNFFLKSDQANRFLLRIGDNGTTMIVVSRKSNYDR